MKIAFFLEDVGHEKFLTNLVSRIAQDHDIRLKASVLNATGGAPRLDEEFEKFMRDYSTLGFPRFDLVIVAKDTDCRGVQTVVNELLDRVQRLEYS